MPSKNKYLFITLFNNNDHYNLKNASHSFLHKAYKKVGSKKSKNRIIYETIIANTKYLKNKPKVLETKLLAAIEKEYGSISKNDFNTIINRFLKQMQAFLEKQKLMEYGSAYDKKSALRYFYKKAKVGELVDENYADTEKLLLNEKTNKYNAINYDRFNFYKNKASYYKDSGVEKYYANIENSLTALNEFYISNSLLYANGLLMYKLNYKKPYTKLNFPKISKKILKNDLSIAYYQANKILIKIYKQKYAKVSMQKVKTLLDFSKEVDISEVYSVTDIKSLYQIKLGICVYMFAHSAEYAQEFRETLLEMERRNLLLENQNISARMFKSIVELLNVSAYEEESDLFFERYNTHIAEDLKEQYALYCEALLAFNKSEVSEELIQKLENTKKLLHKPHLYFSIKRLLFKIYYQESKFDKYTLLLGSMQKALSRKDIPEQSIAEIKNFLSIVQKIIDAKNVNTKAFQSFLNKELKEPLQMLDLKWLKDHFLTRI